MLHILINGIEHALTKWRITMKNLTQEYLDKLKDRLDDVSDIEDYDAIQKEAEEVMKFTDILRNYQNNEFLADYAEDFLIALSMNLEHISGFAQGIAEDAVKYKEEVEREAEEDEAHIADMSHSSRYI